MTFCARGTARIILPYSRKSMFGYSPFTSTTNFGGLTSSTISSTTISRSPWSSPVPVPVATNMPSLAKAAAAVVGRTTQNEEEDEEVVYQHGNVEVLVTPNQIHHGNVASSSSTQQQHPTKRPSIKCFPTTKPNVLQLEGDAFVINSNNICRTLYRLVSENDDSSSSGSRFQIEELYNIKQATKEFILRENNHIVDEHPIDDDDVVIHLGKQVGIIHHDNNNVAHHDDDSSHIFINEIDYEGGDGGIFGSSAGTGGTTWESSLVMSLFFGQYPHFLTGDVLELGSGVGVGAIMTHRVVEAAATAAAAAAATAATAVDATTENTTTNRHHNNRIKSVTISDGNMKVLQQCRSNLFQNGFTVLRNGKGDNHTNEKTNNGSVTINTIQLNWHSPHLMYDVNGHTYDTIVASDCIYLYPDVKAFANTVAALLKRQTNDNHHTPMFHYFGPSNRAPLQEFIKELCHTHQMKVTLNPLDMIRYRLKEDDRAGGDCYHSTTTSDNKQHLEQLLLLSKVASSHSSTVVHMEVTHTFPTRTETSSSSEGGKSMNKINDTTTNTSSASSSQSPCSSSSNNNNTTTTTITGSKTVIILPSSTKTF